MQRPARQYRTKSAAASDECERDPSIQVPPHVATAAAARAVLGILAGELAYAGLQLSCYGAEALAAAIELECLEMGTTGLGAERMPYRG